MVKDKSKRKTWPLARWRIWVQAGFLLAWLDPFLLRTARNLLARVSLLFVSLGHVCLPDRHPGPIRRAARDSVSCPGNLAGRRVAVRQSRLRLGLPLRIAAGPRRADSDAQAAAAGLAGIDALRGSGGPGVSGSLLLRGGKPWFICRVCPAGALEAAVPYSIQQSIAQHAVVWPSVNKRSSWRCSCFRCSSSADPGVRSSARWARSSVCSTTCRWCSCGSNRSGATTAIYAATCANTMGDRNGGGATSAAFVVSNARDARPSPSRRCFIGRKTCRSGRDCRSLSHSEDECWSLCDQPTQRLRDSCWEIIIPTLDNRVGVCNTTIIQSHTQQGVKISWPRQTA